MKQFLLFLLFVVYGECSLYAQNTETWFVDAYEQQLEVRVKQIDEFMTRFNFSTSYDGKPISVDSNLKRKKLNILSLLDWGVFRTQQKTLLPIAEEFCDTICTRHPKISYAESDWFASVDCSAMYKGKSTGLTMLLKPEQIQYDEFKWSIIGVECKVINTSAINSYKQQSKAFISPAEHGINFMSLPSMLKKNPKRISSYVTSSQQAEALSVFEYLVFNGQLAIQEVKKVSYHFHVLDYAFVVERKDRINSLNSGWLITQLSKSPKQ